MEEIISIGKIINFHGIQGYARVGYSNAEVIKGAKKVFVKEGEKTVLTVEKVTFHKNFALMKFKEINSIDELLPFKGKNIYLEKEAVKESLPEEEFLIQDLIGLKVFDNEEEFIGFVEDVQTSNGNDILCIKKESNEGVALVPFARELVPVVDIKGGKIIIKPIEGLL